MGAMINSSRYMVLRYEQLVTEPGETLQALCQFIGINFSEQMLAYQDDVARKVPTDKMSLWPSLKGPLNAANVGRWRGQMRLSQRILFEQRAGTLLRELGYETLEEGYKSFSAMLLEIWYCLDQGARLKRLRKKMRKWVQKDQGSQE
jgi:hypothetical protein